MRTNTDHLSHYESNFNLQRPTLSIFVKTNDSTRQLVVCCRRDEMIKSVCKTIANIYFKTFMSEGCSDDSGDEFGQDYYYQNFENDSVLVEHLEFDGYVLPALHKIGDLLDNKAVVTAKIAMTGRTTRKESKSKTKSKIVVKKEEKVEKKPKVKKEPKEKKARQSKIWIDSDSDGSLALVNKKVKTSIKGLNESKMEEMEEVKLDVRQGVRHDDSEIEEIEPRPSKKKPSVTKKPAAVAKKSPQKKENAKKQEKKPVKEEIIIDGSDSDSNDEPIKFYNADSRGDEIMKPKPKMQVEPEVTKKPEAEAGAKAQPAKLQPSKTIILAGMSEKLFGEESEEEPLVKPKTKMQVEPEVTKKPEAEATTTKTPEAQKETKVQSEENKKEEKPAASRVKIRMDSADSIEFPKKKENVPETKMPKETAKTKNNEVKEKPEDKKSEDEVKPIEKEKMQVEPPAPPAAATQEKSQIMKPPEDKKSKRNAPAQNPKKKSINFSDDSDEVPSPKVPEKQKNGSVEQHAKPKPKVDPIVVPSVIPKEHAKPAKVTEKAENKEVIELMSPSSDSNAGITMTTSVQVTGPLKVDVAEISRKLNSLNEQVKPLLEDESPVVFKIHELIDSEEEKKAKASESKKTKKAKASEGKQSTQEQKKTGSTFMEDLSASLSQLVKTDANGKGKNKTTAKAAKKKKASSSSSGSESEVAEVDTKKQHRNVNLFQ